MGNIWKKPATPVQINKNAPIGNAPKVSEVSQQFLSVDDATKPTQRNVKYPDAKHYLAELRRDARALIKPKATQGTDHNEFTANVSVADHAEAPSRIVKNPVKSGLGSSAAVFQPARKPTEVGRITAKLEEHSTFRK
ncbi:MAG: hypothetical protein A3F13_05040 [Gammaproteobacteria bacterium RIFCSPHIGHO2_12_FULL_40_19]|nr:MAG: hypothetical protein A3F13_05040 [Gammaproteobacteria bacterium RIFCSPHIGHO2_12_FULL_40_19]